MSRLSLPEMLIPQHNLTRYIRVGLSAEDGVMIWRRPRRILGVIPFGSREIRIPVDEIDSMRIQNRTIRWWRLPIPIAIIVTAATLTPWQLMVPLILFGAWTAFVSFGPFLEAETRDGAAQRVAASRRSPEHRWWPSPGRARP